MNREGIRRLAAEELGLPTSVHRFASTLKASVQHVTTLVIQTLLNLSCPLLARVSPVLRAFDEVDAAWEYAMQGGRVNQGTVIIESQIDFDFEITLLNRSCKNPETGKSKPIIVIQLDIVRMQATMLKAGSHNP